MIEIDFISGEKIQEATDIFLGLDSDFQVNPKFKTNSKSLSLDKIPDSWNNPFTLFCYGNRFIDFLNHLHKLKNPFVLVVGNSDENIIREKCESLLQSNLFIKGFFQNLCFEHPKLNILPIGLANSHYSHGNQDLYAPLLSNIQKRFMILSSFTQQTNLEKRLVCLKRLEECQIPNLHFGSQEQYLLYLQKTCFCICPEGNGVDVHRFWEAQILECVPICLKTPFTQMLQDLGFPCVLLNSWDEFSPSKLPPYESFIFQKNSLTNKYWINKIKESTIQTSPINIIFSFIGNLPEYAKISVAQLRLFYNGPIYLLYSEISTSLKNVLENMNVKLINVSEFPLTRFNEVHKTTKFPYVDYLTGRENLFKLSYQRLYLLHECMKKYNIENVLSLENDIMFYINPEEFYETLICYPYMFSYHDEKHGNISTIWLKSAKDMEPLLQTLDEFKGEFMSEMMAMRLHIDKQDTPLFPLMYKVDGIDSNYYKNFDKFQNTIFDGAVIGQYLFGVDPCNANGKIKQKNIEPIKHLLNIWKDGSIEWEQKGNVKVPLLKINESNYKIANLHIHSKDLTSALSYPIFNDIVTCLGPDEVQHINRFLHSCNKYVQNIGTVWLLASDPSIVLNILDKEITNVRIIDEKRFPFCIDTIKKKVGSKRAGWYLQQLLKLYTPIVLERLSDNFVYIDSDIVFTNKVYFFESDGSICLNVGTEYHKPYFAHIDRLYPKVQKVVSYLSGICHLMPMKKSIVKKLLADIEDYHKDSLKSFWELFIDFIDSAEYEKSGASEYELLFNYTLLNFKDQCKIRPLDWRDRGEPSGTYSGAYEACHVWIQKMKNI